MRMRLRRIIRVMAMAERGVGRRVPVVRICVGVALQRQHDIVGDFILETVGDLNRKRQRISGQRRIGRNQQRRSGRLNRVPMRIGGKTTVQMCPGGIAAVHMRVWRVDATVQIIMIGKRKRCRVLAIHRIGIESDANAIKRAQQGNDLRRRQRHRRHGLKNADCRRTDDAPRLQVGQLGIGDTAIGDVRRAVRVAAQRVATMRMHLGGILRMRMRRRGVCARMQMTERGVTVRMRRQDVDAIVIMRRLRKISRVHAIHQISIETTAGAIGSRNNCHQLRRRQIDRRASACTDGASLDRRRRHAGQLGACHCAICQFRRRRCAVGKLRRRHRPHTIQEAPLIRHAAGFLHRHHAGHIQRHAVSDFERRYKKRSGHRQISGQHPMRIQPDARQLELVRAADLLRQRRIGQRAFVAQAQHSAHRLRLPIGAQHNHAEPVLRRRRGERQRNRRIIDVRHTADQRRTGRHRHCTTAERARQAIEVAGRYAIAAEHGAEQRPKLLRQIAGRAAIARAGRSPEQR